MKGPFIPRQPVHSTITFWVDVRSYKVYVGVETATGPVELSLRVFAFRCVEIQNRNKN